MSILKTIILLGAPGSGKGTQSSIMLSKIENLIHISTGDLLRACKSDTNHPLSEKVSKIMADGLLVDDSIVNDIIHIKIENLNLDQANYTVILDGYPRSKSQAVFFSDLCKTLNLEAPSVLFLKIHTETLIERIMFRVLCKNCGAIYNLKTNAPRVDGICDSCGFTLETRTDDNPETITRRMQVFDDSISPILSHYQNVAVIDASKPEDQVFNDIKTACSL
jgi:adenylate kinase